MIQSLHNLTFAAVGRLAVVSVLSQGELLDVLVSNIFSATLVEQLWPNCVLLTMQTLTPNNVCEKKSSIVYLTKSL